MSLFDQEMGPPARAAGGVVAEPVDLADAEIVYLPSFFTAAESARLTGQLLAGTRWRQDEFRIYGRAVAIPRLNAWYGDPGCVYTYSRITLEPLGWTEPLLEIRGRLEGATRVRFNSVLVNLYRDGRDSVAWHADDEPELGPEPLIASVSFGATRTFQLRRRDDRRVRHSIALADGSVLVMGGPTQRYWVHQVPKTNRPVGARINLTFRSLVTDR